MQQPYLQGGKSAKKQLRTFAGLSREPRPKAGELTDMENLTAENYPLLSVRSPRRTHSVGAVGALAAKDGLCYIRNGDFYLNDYCLPLGLTPGDKQLVSMGAYVIILPDKVYVNTADLTDHGPIEAEKTCQNVHLTLCREDGTACLPQSCSDTAPAEPQDGQLWLDSGQQALMQYSEATGLWVNVIGTYVKLSAAGIGAPFSPYDGVSLSGLTGAAAKLNGANVIWQCQEDALLIPGLLEAEVMGQTVCIRRSMPQLDFVVESGNRLWGCRYGLQDGQVVNSIYCSKLGDFKNWNCFMGLSTDSYALSLGSDGPFTGAVCYLGQPLFFKEGCLHRIYGSMPENFQLQTTNCRGVQRGCDQSLALVGETLLYKSRDGVMAYDGGLPRLVSRSLGSQSYHSAAAGSVGERYYISMADSQDNWHLLVYDLRRELWHREDSLKAKHFCTWDDGLYALDVVGQRVLGLSGHLPQTLPAESEPVRFLACLAPVGVGEDHHKQIHRLQLHLEMSAGAVLAVEIRYDGQSAWEPVWQMTATGHTQLQLPLRPRRCRSYQLRLFGQGDCRLLAISQYLQEGSDLP